MATTDAAGRAGRVRVEQGAKRVRTDLLVATATVTHSPSRGDAQHFTIKAGGKAAEDAALRYADSPITELRDLLPGRPYQPSCRTR